MLGFYQPQIPPLPSSLDLTGKTIVVTGATRGIGYESCLQLLRHKASFVVLAVRDLAAGKAAVSKLLGDEEIQRENPNAQLKVVELDLTSFESVVEFATNLTKEVDSLDLLILNAGINLAQFEKTVDGNEILIQVNYLSNALLAILLLPLLQKSPAGRITWVGSMGQAFTSIYKDSIELSESILEHFADPAKYSKIHRYPDSKLLVAMFVRQFGKYIQGTDTASTMKKQTMPLSINCVCPGTTDTAADNNLPFWLRIPMNLNRRFRARTVEDGAAAILNAAVMFWPTSNGKYIANNEISALAPIADTPYGKSFESKLWKETLEECSRIDSRCEEIISSYGFLK